MARHLRRALLRKPGITLLAVASLGLAIGVSTAAFSILDAYSLRELPVRDPRTLAWIYAIGREQRPEQFSWIEYQALITRSHNFAGIVAEDREAPRVRLPDCDDFLPRRSRQRRHCHHYAPLLAVGAGVRSERTRANPGSGNVSVTNHWRAGPGFTGIIRGLLVDLFVPHQVEFGSLQLSRPGDARAKKFQLLGRLRPGIAPEQGRTELDHILKEVAAEGRAPEPERHAQLGEFTERSLAAKLSANALLLAVALLLILIAAANVANLRMLENEGRRLETGIRLALGAGRAAMARQHLTETLLLPRLGLGARLTLAAVLIAPSIFYGGQNYLDFGIRLDVRTFAFSAAALLPVVPPRFTSITGYPVVKKISPALRTLEPRKKTMLSPSLCADLSVKI